MVALGGSELVGGRGWERWLTIEVSSATSFAMTVV